MPEVFILHLDPVLNTDLLKSIREAAQDGADAVVKMVEASSTNPLVGPGGRIPRTDPDTLSKLNAPCATCGHSYNHHAIGGDGGNCLHCFPKGSQHKYHETMELVQHQVNAPLTHSDRPPDLRAGLESGVTFTEVEQALIRLSESIYPSYDEQYQKVSDETRKQAKAASSRASLYNSHSLAAHRASAQAYSSGSEADHEVAAQHHDLAASAATSAQGVHKSGTPTHKDYGTASTYHKSQATAHRNAAKASNSGNTVRHPGITPSYY